MIDEVLLSVIDEIAKLITKHLKPNKMTKCIDLRQNPARKPIKFKYGMIRKNLPVLSWHELSIVPNSAKPSDWNYIELIGKHGEYDIMFAYDSPENRDDNSCLYLGHWNDGVV